jgi:hypothetical protein
MKISTIIVAGLIMASVYNAYSNGPSPSYRQSTNYNSTTYTDCINDPIIEYKVSQYQQKYPNLSKNQITHILCK